MECDAVVQAVAAASGVPLTGLTALRDRVASVGGSVHVDSPVGDGTTVSAVM